MKYLLTVVLALFAINSFALECDDLKEQYAALSRASFQVVDASMHQFIYQQYGTDNMEDAIAVGWKMTKVMCEAQGAEVFKSQLDLATDLYKSVLGVEVKRVELKPTVGERTEQVLFKAANASRYAQDNVKRSASYIAKSSEKAQNAAHEYMVHVFEFYLD